MSTARQRTQATDSRAENKLNLRDLRSQSRSHAFAVAALAYLVVAVGLEVIEGMELPSLTSYSVRHFLKLVEETLEMLGNTLFLPTFSSVLLHHIQKVSIDLP